MCGEILSGKGAGTFQSLGNKMNVKFIFIHVTSIGLAIFSMLEGQIPPLPRSSVLAKRKRLLCSQNGSFITFYCWQSRSDYKVCVQSQPGVRGLGVVGTLTKKYVSVVD